MLGVGLWSMNVGWDAFTATPQNVAYFLGSDSEYKLTRPLLGIWMMMMMLSKDTSARVLGYVTR